MERLQVETDYRGGGCWLGVKTGSEESQGEWERYEVVRVDV